MAEIKIISQKKPKSKHWKKGDYGKDGDTVFIVGRDNEGGEWYCVSLKSGVDTWGIPDKATKFTPGTELHIKI